MRYGLVFPSMDVHVVPDLAAEAEAAGWDGVFIPDCIWIEGVEDEALGYDPWITLAAVATRTERIRFGTMITPPSRRRPWKLARETVSLDRLSNGRLILPVGLGALDDAGFGKVGEATDRKTRAQLLDESLQILTGLWSGEPFAHHGDHYDFDAMTFRPTPVQQPRIPIWVVGLWGSERSMARALRYDGLLPNKRGEDGIAEILPEDIREMAAYVEEHRGAGSPFDIILEGSTPAGSRDQALQEVGPYVEAGISWWLESFWSPPNDTAAIRRRIEAGPPSVS